jgi:hypothetical protein
MTTPQAAQRRAAAPAPVRTRVKAAVCQRQHVEQLSLVIITMVVSSLMELHAYTALSLFSVVAIGCRDILIVLLFAEEEGFASLVRTPPEE